MRLKPPEFAAKEEEEEERYEGISTKARSRWKGQSGSKADPAAPVIGCQAATPTAEMKEAPSVTAGFDCSGLKPGGPSGAGPFLAST